MNNGKKKIVFLTFWAGIIYLVAFLPVLRSDYMYDDLYNYTARGYAMIHGQSLLEMTFSFARMWFEQSGRVYFFAWYMYIFFAVVGLTTYKLLIISLSFIDGLLLGGIVSEILGRERLKWICIILFPLFVQLDCSSFNSMYGFHMLVQVVCFFTFGGIYCFIRYVKSGNGKWQIGSCVCLFISLGVYEISYVLCIIYLIVGLYYYRNIWEFIVKVIPQMVIGIGWVMVNIYARINAVGRYAGTSVKLGALTAVGILKQLTGSTCITNNIIQLQNITAADFSMLKVARWCIVVVMIVGFNVYIMRKLETVVTKGDANRNVGLFADRDTGQKCLFNISLSLLLMPSILMGLSERWQSELVWGKGYIPAFAGAWGGVLMVALFVDWLSENVKFKTTIAVISTMIIFIGLPNQIIADKSVDAAGTWNHKKDVLYEEAMEAGIFEDVAENETVVDGSYIWVGMDQHYTQVLDRITNAYGISELYIADGTSITKKEIFEKLTNKDCFKFFLTPNDCSCVLKANCISLSVDYMEGNLTIVPKTRDFYLYVPYTTDYSCVIVSNDDGSIETVGFSDAEVIGETSKGRTYHFIIANPANVYAFVVQ